MRTKFTLLIVFAFTTFGSYLPAQVINREKAETLSINPDGSYVTKIQSQMPDVSTLKKQNNWSPGKNRATHSLTIRFEEYSSPEEVGDIIVQNEEFFFDRSSLSAAQIEVYVENNRACAKLDALDEGEYHIMLDNRDDQLCNGFFNGYNNDSICRIVFMHLNLDRDIDTVVNLAAMARHKVEIATKTETGEVIPYNSGDNLSQASYMHMHLPGLARDNRLLQLYPKQLPDYPDSYFNYLMVSDIDEAFSFVCTDGYFQDGKIYIADCEEQHGCTANVTVTNNPADYKAMEWSFNSRPRSGNVTKYLTFQFYNFLNRKIWQCGTGSGRFMDGSYPVEEGKRISIYLSNEERLGNQVSGQITYWEGMPDPYDRNLNYIDFPFFLTDGDSVVFTELLDIIRKYNYKFRADDASNPVRLDPVGQESLSFATATLNNSSDPLTISPYWLDITGQLMACSNSHLNYMRTFEASPLSLNCRMVTKYC